MSSPSEDTERAILAAARGLLVEHGYHGVGLGEIGRAAGVSRQTVYLHFGSKAALLRALRSYVDEVEGIGELFAQFAAARTAEEALSAVVAVHVGITPRIFDVASVMQAASRSDEDAAEAWREAGRERHAALRRVAAWLARDGRLAADWTVGTAADFMWMLTSIHTYEHLVVERGWSLRAYARHLERVLRQTMLVGPAGGARSRGADRRA